MSVRGVGLHPEVTLLEQNRLSRLIHPALGTSLTTQWPNLARGKITNLPQMKSHAPENSGALALTTTYWEDKKYKL